MLAFYIYLIGIVDDLSFTIDVIFIITLVISGLGLLMLSTIEGDTSFCKKYIFWSILILIINCFTPSSKTLASMVMIPAVANNEQVQNIGKNSLTILEELTKQWVIDITSDSNKESNI